jgi:hypothetical protein
VHKVGVTGELPQLPDVPGLHEFEAAGGSVVHSSRHKTTPDMAGKKAVIVGAATSAHDLGWELYERGLDVTMIQRSSTFIMSCERGVRIALGRFKNVNKPNGLTMDVADRGQWLGAPFPINYVRWSPRGKLYQRRLSRNWHRECSRSSRKLTRRFWMASGRSATS